LKIRIVRLDSAVPMPSYQTAGAAGFDLAAAADLTIQPGQIALVPTGLVIAVPAGHFLGIFARSSTPLKRGLVVANGVGVLDSDYSGPTDELKIQLMNVASAPVDVKRGDRLAQGVILPFVRAEFEEVSAATTADRGGFGSTGT
jgi:dUTP pyrophosphatase